MDIFEVLEDTTRGGISGAISAGQELYNELNREGWEIRKNATQIVAQEQALFRSGMERQASAIMGQLESIEDVIDEGTKDVINASNQLNNAANSAMQNATQDIYRTYNEATNTVLEGLEDTKAGGEDVLQTAGDIIAGAMKAKQTLTDTVEDKLTALQEQTEKVLATPSEMQETAKKVSDDIKTVGIAIGAGAAIVGSIYMLTRKKGAS